MLRALVTLVALVTLNFQSFDNPNSPSKPCAQGSDSESQMCEKPNNSKNYLASE